MIKEARAFSRQVLPRTDGSQHAGPTKQDKVNSRIHYRYTPIAGFDLVLLSLSPPTPFSPLDFSPSHTRRTGCLCRPGSPSYEYKQYKVRALDLPGQPASLLPPPLPHLARPPRGPPPTRPNTTPVLRFTRFVLRCHNQITSQSTRETLISEIRDKTRGTYLGCQPVHYKYRHPDASTHAHTHNLPYTYVAPRTTACGTERRLFAHSTCLPPFNRFVGLACSTIHPPLLQSSPLSSPSALARCLPSSSLHVCPSRTDHLFLDPRPSSSSRRLAVPLDTS